MSRAAVLLAAACWVAGMTAVGGAGGFHAPGWAWGQTPAGGAQTPAGRAQTPAAGAAPAGAAERAAPAEVAGGGAAAVPSRVDRVLAGRNVEQVRVVGNTQTATSVILNAVRTREGEPLDPQTVEEDYQRIFQLRRFSNVEAKVEPTEAGGVVVVFIVAEQRTITSIAFVGNAAISTNQIRDAVDVRVGETIDRFRIALGRQNIERLYRDRNYPFASVDVDEQRLASTGELVYTIVEGPNVRIRKITFPGNQSFEKGTLMKQIRSRSWIFVFRPGRLDFDQLEDDVGALRRFYESKGFFDVRVGRRLRFSPDLSQVQVDFVIDEGKRYEIQEVRFVGVKSIDIEQLLPELRLKAGDFYDRDIEQRDIRQIVRAYSPLGFIYQPPGADAPNPEYLTITPQTVFREETGKLDLVYRVNEGRPFRLGRILVKGNAQSMDKLVLREMRMQPGELFNSSEVAAAMERLRFSPYFSEANATPVGDDPNYRDLLVEVRERQFRSFIVGAGINSNGGVGANLSFEHRNFDIGQVPPSLGELFTDRAFTGAGQRFRISLEPGTELSSASVLFSEPYLFDSPYSFTNEYYYRDRIRPDWRETRLGGRVTFGRRFGFRDAVGLTIRAEDVRIYDIDDKPLRAPEVLDLNGHSFLTTYTLSYTRDTTDRGVLPSRGYTLRTAAEFAAPPGEFDFVKLTVSWDQYFTLYEDLLDRRTIFAIYADTGYIFGSAPFFERFYGGGIGSIRGFRFRGVSPRSGLEDDAVGGDFVLTVTGEVSFPLAGEFLRGVVFVDTGTVERDFEITDYRVSAGAGVRLYLPFFGQTPFALDFGIPIVKNALDDTQIISFSFGFNP